METVEKRLYEGLFLVDTAQAASDWDGTVAVIEKMLSRADAEVVSMRKWDERPLAYEINKKGRGTYILIYFNGDPLKISTIERDVQLSEKVVRVMVLRTDKMSEEQIAGDTPSEAAVKRVAAAAAKADEAAAAAAAAEAEAAVAAAAKADEAAAVESEPVVVEVLEESPSEETSSDATAEEAKEDIKETEPQQ